MNTIEKTRLLSMTALHAALFLALGLFQIVLVKFWQQMAGTLSLATGALLIGALVAGFVAMWANMRASVRFVRALKAGLVGRKPHLLAFGLTLFAVLLNSQVWRTNLVAPSSHAQTTNSTSTTFAAPTTDTRIDEAPTSGTHTPDTMPNSEPN